MCKDRLGLGDCVVVQVVCDCLAYDVDGSSAAGDKQTCPNELGEYEWTVEDTSESMDGCILKEANETES